MTIWSLISSLFVSVAYAQTESIGTLEGSVSVGPTGQAAYSVPVEVPPGIAGMQPKINISYNSLAQNGPLGVGWVISGFSSIVRCRLTEVQDGKFDGVDYDGDDRYCLDGVRLISVSGNYGENNSEYRKEIDDYSKVVVKEVDTANTWPLSFDVHTKAGLRYVYGGKESARVHKGNASSSPVFEWKLSHIWDANGNYIEYHYHNDPVEGLALPTAISYTGNEKSGVTNLNPSRLVLFRYSEDERPDKYIKYQAGIKRALTKRLDALETYITVTGVLRKS